MISVNCACSVVDIAYIYIHYCEYLFLPPQVLKELHLLYR